MKNKSIKWSAIIPFCCLILFISCSKDEDGSKHGTLVYEENFDGNSGWITGNENQGFNSEEKDGHYVVSYRVNTNLVNGNTSPKSIFGQAKRQILEIGYKQTAGVGDPAIFYSRLKKGTLSWIVLNANIGYTVFNHVNEEFNVIQDWSKSTAIQGIGKTNILRIEFENGNVDFFLNNTRLYTWTNSGLSGLDDIGLGAANYTGNNDAVTVIEYDYIKAWTEE